MTAKSNYFWLELANGGQRLLDAGKEVFISEYSEYFWRNSGHE